MKIQNPKSRIANLKSQIGALAKLACGSRLLRLHPKFRWLSYACPILRRSQSSSSSSSNRRVAPPNAPPKLRLRKRRRLSVLRDSVVTQSQIQNPKS